MRRRITGPIASVHHLLSIWPGSRYISGGEFTLQHSKREGPSCEHQSIARQQARSGSTGNAQLAFQCDLRRRDGYPEQPGELYQLHCNGLNNWLNALANGSSTFAVAAAFVTSQERDVGLIRGDYQLFLGRNPRTDEIVAWLTQFQNGSNRAMVEAGIIASNEFFAQASKDPSTFIVHTYQDVFLRTPSQAEINIWLNVYNQNNKP